jgi:hypothetical protein
MGESLFLNTSPRSVSAKRGLFLWLKYNKISLDILGDLRYNKHLHTQKELEMTADIFNDRIQLIDKLIADADEGTFDIEMLYTLTLEEIQELYTNIFVAE